MEEADNQWGLAIDIGFQYIIAFTLHLSRAISLSINHRSSS
jgi:hypothetical protein